MSRRRKNYLDTIEYIGPRPQKAPRRPNFLAGWFVLLVAVAAICFVGKPFIPLLRAQQVAPTAERADVLIAQLQPSARIGDRLAAAALQRTQASVAYEDAYYKIDYPNGDIPSGKGRAEDLVVRAYRALGIDLQQRVHEDMVRNFAEYPQIFGRSAADQNIDHRLTANLQRFFRRSGAELLVSGPDGEGPSQNPADYQTGDIVTWRLAGGRSHIGIVVPGPAEKESEAWVVHNIAEGPVWEDCLFNFKVVGHYRYTGEEEVDVTSLAPSY
jgi:uncharacterized protein YijF (DUF1287 family)